MSTKYFKDYKLQVLYNAHFVLLGINYTLKINWWPIDASHFDESYASPSQNGKNQGFLPRGVDGQAKTLYSASPSLGCANFGPFNWSPSGHQGLAATRAIMAP